MLRSGRMTNKEIADRLREMAICYEMDGIAFKPAAYERAADAIDALPEPVTDINERGGGPALDGVPGVGKAIAAHIVALLSKGTFKEYETCRRKMPADVLALTAIEGVGPKTMKRLYRDLGVRTVQDLERAAEEGRIRELEGFGEKRERKILEAVRHRRSHGGRRLLGHVLPLTRRIEDALLAVPGVTDAVTAGSVRRRQETIGDIDVVIAAKDPERAIRTFLASAAVERTLERGPTKAVVLLTNGMHCDIRAVEGECFGAALQYFTGDKDHNVAVRRLAADKGLKLNEYGLWEGRRRIASRTEEDVYAALGLPYIEPELRTASGELEAAAEGRLPDILPYGAVRGDLQTQSAWTDGSASIADMADAAMALGLDYIAITDHTKTLAMTGGLDEADLARQGKEIDRLNGSYALRRSPFRILKGAEVNILKDGTLDIDDKALSRLDVVGAAVHSSFRLPRKEQTDRIVRAMRNPHVDVIFHPTGRLIGRREPMDLDIGRLIKTAKETGTALEIDAHPARTDLRDVHVRAAVSAGVKLVIDTDAHSPEHLAYLDLGVAAARRGWAGYRDVLNALPLSKLHAWLKTPKADR